MNLLLTGKMDSSMDLLDDAMNAAMDFSETSLGDTDTTLSMEQLLKVDIGSASEQTACKVCGDSATGMYFGAQVCVPCKTFFLRYASDSSTFTCKFNRLCVITPSNRTQCKYCRYQKCIQAGMCRRVRPMQVQINEGQQMCMVCNDVANGVHFGALTCEGCKKFFRRGLVEHKTYSCKADQKCIINPRTRNSCRYCRYVKCLSVGMSREAIQMGRPSKHKAHANALLRQKEWKIKVDEDQAMVTSGSGWSQSDSNGINGRLKIVSRRTLSEAADSADPVGEELSPDEGYTELSPTVPFNRRTTSIGSTNTVSDAVSVDSDSNSSAEVKHELYQFSPVARRPSSTGRRSIEQLSVKAVSGVSTPDRVDVKCGADTKNVLSPDEASRARVWSGGYCCEIKSNSHDIKPPVKNEDVNSDWLNLQKYMKENSFEAYLSNGQHADSLNGELDSSSSYCVSRSNGMRVGRHTSLSRRMSSVMPISREPSPGIRWRTNNDRDSPYISVMALASSCHLFSEACRSPLLEGVSSDVPEETIVSSENYLMNCDSKMFGYWLHSDLPDENILFTEKHCELINRITAAYDRFVQTGTTINQTLTNELANWQQLNAESTQNLSLPGWIQMKVVPVYTVTSITYCKSLPGFTEFFTEDQATLIRLGQSPSRILVACIHWYEPEKANFRNFLSWRSDLFKKKLIDYAQKIQQLEIDHIEAAVLNALTLIATDYPGLKNPDSIEELRKQILSAFRAYTTAKLGTPNQRIETLFKFMPEVRQLGMLHFKMTMTSSLQAEEVEKL